MIKSIALNTTLLLAEYFPKRVSYNRFIELQQRFCWVTAQKHAPHPTYAGLRVIRPTRVTRLTG